MDCKFVLRLGNYFMGTWLQDGFLPGCPKLLPLLQNVIPSRRCTFSGGPGTEKLFPEKLLSLIEKSNETVKLAGSCKKKRGWFECLF